MTKYKRKIIILGILTISIVVGLCVQTKFFDTKNPLKITKSEINELISNGEIQNGDLIFQTSLSDQSKAIQLATKSKYSHCGLLYKEGNNVYVLEAVQPVKLTPIHEWINHGKDEKYVIKRLKNASEILTPSAIQKMKEIADDFIGKKYDKTFEWSDDKIYCSELIWKIYLRATGLQIGQTQKLRDFDLSSETVQSILKVRYVQGIPMDETVISPQSIFESELLITVASNN